MAKIKEKEIQTAVQWIKEAEVIWLGAGSGLTADAGPAFDYGNKEYFAQYYPGLVKQGFSRKIELMGAMNLPPELFWGYYAQNVNEVRFSQNGQEVYTKLLDIMSTKEDYFVITTNVDRLFSRNGFPEDKIYTPQGDYGQMQCMTPCREETWDSKPIVENIITDTEHKTQRTTTKSVPKCIFCGGGAFLNVRGADWFVHKPYEPQAARYQQWLKHALTKKILLIDIGSGPNTPVWVRYPADQITYQNENSHLIRINPMHPQIPKEIRDRSISFQNGALEVINKLWIEIRN